MRVILKTDPFAHLVARDVLPPELAAAVLSALRDAIPWTLRKGSFYCHYGVDLGQHRDCAAIDALFKVDIVDRFRALIGAAFAVDLGNKLELWAHKLETAQGIGPHNDNDPQEFRFVIQLGIETPGVDAGNLLLFDASGRAVVGYQPFHNTAVCFNTNETSYHAVSEVSGATRYSLVYVLSKPASPEEATASALAAGLEPALHV